MWKLFLVVAAIVTVVTSYVDDACDDPNAALPPEGCSWNCNRHCSNYIYDRKDHCARIACQPDECGCKKGYYYDENTKKCVLGDDCSYPQPE